MIRGAGVRSPTTNVSRVQFLDPASYMDWVCCWFSSLLRGFFSGFSGFPPSSKTNISKFQFDQEFEGHGFISWRLLCVTLVTQSWFIYWLIDLFIYLLGLWNGQVNQILCCEEATWHYLLCMGLIAIIIVLSHSCSFSMYQIHHWHYWLVLSRWFMDLDSLSVHKHTKKQNYVYMYLANIQPSWPHARSITDMCYLPTEYPRHLSVSMSSWRSQFTTNRLCYELDNMQK